MNKLNLMPDQAIKMIKIQESSEQKADQELTNRVKEIHKSMYKELISVTFLQGMVINHITHQPQPIFIWKIIFSELVNNSAKDDN